MSATPSSRAGGAADEAPEVAGDAGGPASAAAPQPAEQPRAKYFIAGTWSRWTPLPMHWDGSLFSAVVKIGRQGWESFCILLEGRWDARIYPSVRDAGPSVKHTLRGPSDKGRGQDWTIGHAVLAGFDPFGWSDVRPGSEYKVMLTVDGEWRAVRVTWELCLACSRPGAGDASASAATRPEADDAFLDARLKDFITGCTRPRVGEVVVTPGGFGLPRLLPQRGVGGAIVPRIDGRPPPPPGSTGQLGAGPLPEEPGLLEKLRHGIDRLNQSAVRATQAAFGPTHAQAQRRFEKLFPDLVGEAVLASFSCAALGPALELAPAEVFVGEEHLCWAAERDLPSGGAPPRWWVPFAQLPCVLRGTACGEDWLHCVDKDGGLWSTCRVTSNLGVPLGNSGKLVAKADCAVEDLHSHVSRCWQVWWAEGAASGACAYASARELADLALVELSVTGLGVPGSEERGGATLFAVDVSRRHSEQPLRLWRRWEEFKRLHDALGKAGAGAGLPPWSLFKLDKAGTEARRAGLSKFVAEALDVAQGGSAQARVALEAFAAPIATVPLAESDAVEVHLADARGGWATLRPSSEPGTLLLTRRQGREPPQCRSCAGRGNLPLTEAGRALGVHWGARCRDLRRWVVPTR